MKKITLLLLLLVPVFAIAQNPGFTVLKKINGVSIYYKMTKTKEGDKKDSWLIEFEYGNESGKDLFYKSSLQEAGTMDQIMGNNSKVENADFAFISIENTKALSFSSGSINLFGDRLRIKTDKDESIFILKKGKTYTKTLDFKGNKGIEPVLNVQIVNSISFTDQINDFF